MRLATESVLSRLVARWEGVVGAPFNATQGPMAAYRRFVLAHVEFSSAVRILDAAKEGAFQHVERAVARKGDWELPGFRDDAEEAAFGWALLERFGGGAGGGSFAGTVAQYAHRHSGVKSTVEAVPVAVQALIGPVHRYLMEQVEVDALLLHHFERFAIWARWFGHVSLQECLRAEAESASKRKRWEEALKARTVEWIFSDGAPLADISREPNSASGSIDLVVHLPTRRRAIIEAKLLGRFGSSVYRPADIGAAVRQLRTYVNDVAADAYLLVFHNHPGEVLVEATSKVRRVPAAPNSFDLVFPDAMRVGLILVRLLAPAAPSSAGAPLVLTSADLGHLDD